MEKFWSMLSAAEVVFDEVLVATDESDRLERSDWSM
jgi:hypothetical protein